MPTTTPDVKRLTVLYDATCELCRASRAWLEDQPTYVPLSFVAAGSAMARSRFPALDAAATLREITVIDDTGGVYRGAKAWLICLWATRRYRDWSLTLASPAAMPAARRFIAWVARNRRDLGPVGRLWRRMS